MNIIVSSNPDADPPNPWGMMASMENLLALMEERDAEAVDLGGATFHGVGRGVLTTDEVRAALLGVIRFDGLSG